MSLVDHLGNTLKRLGTTMSGNVDSLRDLSKHADIGQPTTWRERRLAADTASPKADPKAEPLPDAIRYDPDGRRYELRAQLPKSARYPAGATKYFYASRNMHHVQAIVRLFGAEMVAEAVAHPGRWYQRHGDPQALAGVLE